ncbi:hypothetical protein MYX82_04320 [Acidobacteria bacterium AH-259-D05]|nr:hypothetical protein [Acidobacteria bacterium AH-259-D05]
MQCPTEKLKTAGKTINCQADLEVYLSLVRGRVALLSCWLHFARGDINQNREHMASFVSRVIDYGTVNCHEETRNAHRVVPDSDFVIPELCQLWEQTHVGESKSLEDTYRDYLIFAVELIKPRFATRNIPGTCERNSIESARANRFTSVILTLRAPLPDGFSASRDMERCRDVTDWHCSVAAFLPQVIAEPNSYHPSYLHELLGVDLMDTRDGHYFVTRRILLAVDSVAADEVVRESNANLVTWSQLLAENVATQLEMISAYNRELNYHLTHASSIGRDLHNILDRKREEQLDLEEFYNVAISGNPIFWQHLQIIKKVNGVDDMYGAVVRKLDGLVNMSVLQEQKRFSKIAQWLTVIFGSLGVSTITEAALIYAEQPLEDVVFWTVVSFLATGTAVLVASRLR